MGSTVPRPSDPNSLAYRGILHPTSRSRAEVHELPATDSVDSQVFGLPPGAKIVHAAGELSLVSLSDEVADMPPERNRAFQAELESIDDATRNLIVEDEALGL